MKKLFIIFLIFILTLCSFSVTMAQEEPVDVVESIREQLNKIEENVKKEDLDEANLCLEKLAEYIYKWASELIEQNKYTAKVLNIYYFSSKAIEEKNVIYIATARQIIEEILNSQVVYIPQEAHS